MDIKCPELAQDLTLSQQVRKRHGFRVGDIIEDPGEAGVAVVGHDLCHGQKLDAAMREEIQLGADGSAQTSSRSHCSRVICGDVVCALLEQAQGHPAQNLVLALEVISDDPFADASLLRDASDGRGGVTDICQNFGGCTFDLLTSGTASNGASSFTCYLIVRTHTMTLVRSD